MSESCTESWPESGAVPVPYELTFSHLLSLVERIGSIEPRKAQLSTTQRAATTEDRVKDTFRRWRQSLKEPLFQGCTKIIFRLLFPEHDTRRTYDMQETRLIEALSDVLEIPHAKERLKSWLSLSFTPGRPVSGCLGDEVRRVAFTRPMNTPGMEISLHDIDCLLDELAAHSPFSDVGVVSSAPPPRPRKQIIADLYRTLTPQGAACMTQIILKDLRPLLYPMPSSRTTSNLLHYNANALHELTIHEAMHIWDPRMLKIYRIRATVDAAADSFDGLVAGAPQSEVFCPTFGVPIEIPKCMKGQGCKKVIETLQNGPQSETAWAETKYDGERMQIHIDQTRQLGDQIRIISKSKRDSTLDRVASHCVIQASLGFPITTPIQDELILERRGSNLDFSRQVQRTAILEAELVCYNESEKRIDEFWRIRSLLESTAQGARSRFHAARLRSLDAREEDSQDNIHQDSLESNASDGGRRHFMLVFFDVLYVDGASLVSKSYEHRRKTLERIINPIPGFSVLAERVQIKLGQSDSIEQLRSIMARRIAEFEEGLVIKPACSRYNELTPNMRWIKLKKDYIPGLGDTLDLVVVGACWEKDRGRELRVGPETFTTFFIGAIDKALERRRTVRGKVHITILFSCSYGLSRQQLEEFNWDIRNRKYHRYDFQKLGDLSYTFELGKGVFQKPSIMFSEPALLEVSGAGFTKSAGAKHYELRFPRITKIWNPRERSWFDGVDLEEFHRIACAAVGRDPPQKRTSDVMKRIWDLPTSPGMRCPNHQRRLTQDWDSRLAAVDGHQVALKPKRPSRAATWASISPSPSPFRVFGHLSNVEPTPTAPKLLAFGKPEKSPDKERKASLDPDVENNPEVAKPSNSPKTPIPSLVRLPVSPSPTPPPPPVSSPLKRRASSIDIRQHHSLEGGALRLPRKRHSDESTSGVQARPTAALLPSKPPKRQRTELYVHPVPSARPSLNRCSTEVPTLESLLTSPRFGGPASTPKAPRRGVRGTQSMHVMPASKDVPVKWSLDEGSLFYIQPSANPEPYSLVAGRYASQRLGTLDALLWGIGWQQGVSVEFKAQAKRGFIFVDVGEPKCLRELIDSLEARWAGVKQESRPVAGPLFVLSFEDLGNLYRSQSSGSKDITPIWSSCIL
ncbi:hypothetical protein M407DRAFT_25816 [Tulasnella calospora MUT 4182]|uniref:ATP-dependent DNA ligase family profile domain-containing protein n=1 Tax=Tulasnella calospora MUT 4182 TaxID=1051891 RepID=A0A0C3LU26_9AGAM|nr:hypothetical protein M407DRAFT_25816 [Tulasnella calospora MUT 4182]